jgi:hypothetical protein
MIGMDAYECEPRAGKDQNVDDRDYVDSVAVPKRDQNCIDGATVAMEETLARRMRTAELGLCKRFPFSPRPNLPIRSALIEALAIGAFSRCWTVCEARGPSAVDRPMTGAFEQYRQLFHNKVNEYLQPYRNACIVTDALICSHVAVTEHSDVYLVRLCDGLTPTVRMSGKSGICQEFCLDELGIRTMLPKVMSTEIVVFFRANLFVPVASLKLIALAS